MEYNKVSETDFGYAMLVFESKGLSPLSTIVINKLQDCGGVFYIPSIEDYCDSTKLVTGSDLGYKTQEQAMRCVGRCIDKAKKDVKKRREEHENS